MKAVVLSVMLVAMSALGMMAQHQNIINGIKLKYAPDKRVAIFEVCETQKGDTIYLEGKVDNAAAKEALTNEFDKTGVIYINNVKVLPEDSLYPKWALVQIPFAHLRCQPDHSAEMASQALMGTPLKVLEVNDGWYRVQTPDNYISWVINNSVKELTPEEMDTWKKSQRYVVTPVYSYIYSDTKSNEIVSDILLGDILTYEGKKDDFILLSTPDGRKGYAKSEDVEPLDKWVQQTFDADLIVNTAKQLMGSTYTWGGTSTKGVDCSGLTKTSYFANGIILQRDASQQVLYGDKISPILWPFAQKGDLLYFGTQSGRVTHTAIYMGDGLYVHASGRVKVNSVDPKSPKYLTTPFISINRINGNVDKLGITSVKNHPWYF